MYIQKTWADQETLPDVGGVWPGMLITSQCRKFLKVGFVGVGASGSTIMTVYKSPDDSKGPPLNSVVSLVSVPPSLPICLQLQSDLCK
jgi:hypothetical protein